MAEQENYSSGNTHGSTRYAGSISLSTQTHHRRKRRSSCHPVSNRNLPTAKRRSRIMHLESVQLSPEMRTNSETRKRRRATRHQHQSLVHQLFAAATAVVAIAPVLMTGSSALQLSMVASHYRRTTVRPGASKVRSRTFSSPPAHSGVGGVTSSLVSQLAVAALKLRLADQSAVKCDVTADASDLLMRGRVGPVSVRGRGWRSQLGLSCRAIDATVNRCDLDMGVMMSRRKLVLTTPGEHMIHVGIESLIFRAWYFSIKIHFLTFPPPYRTESPPAYS